MILLSSLIKISLKTGSLSLVLFALGALTEDEDADFFAVEAATFSVLADFCTLFVFFFCTVAVEDVAIEDLVLLRRVSGMILSTQPSFSVTKETPSAQQAKSEEGRSPQGRKSFDLTPRTNDFRRRSSNSSSSPAHSSNLIIMNGRGCQLCVWYW